MGLAASSNGASTGSSSGNSQNGGGDIIRRCHCYSMNYLSLDRRCYRHSLTFNHSSDKTAINPKQKKKRSYGFATFKKKLIGKRRHCKGSDHGRCFREYFLDCPSDILKSLLGQYEALTLLKDLSVQADLARPPAQTLGQNLGEIFESESCCDIVLVYQGHHRIAAHKSVLMARCPYFSRHLAFHNSNEFHIRTRVNVSLGVLRALLKYLYTGNGDLLLGQEAISMLEDEFSVPNSLESDISFLLETLSLGDLRLVFDNHQEFLCHKSIVASRSPFLARVIQKKNGNNPVLDINLDSDIIPAKYARVLLNAIYLDNLDFRLMEQCEDHVQDAMNLYEIGRFLEFNFLSQACEDLLMQLMSVENVVRILDWSQNAHGSAWISRQAWQFLEEEFFEVASKMEVLGSLSQDTIVRLLRSDFTQASESEVLQTLVKWGEWQLNSQQQYSTSSVATLGRSSSSKSNAAKRREVCDGELKEMISSMIGQVRVPHVLPRDRTSEALDMALQRNLFPVVPNFSSQVNASTKYSPWDPKANNGLFVRPRLFLPYFEECKKLIQDRCAQDPEIIASNSPCVSVPDTLYMLRSRKEGPDALEFPAFKVPDNEIVTRMIERMKKLVNSHSVQRALCSNFNDANEVMNLVELRVVREFNLPDSYASVLQKARRRSMSSSDFVDRNSGFSSSRMFFQPPAPREFSAGLCTGPDVTLATGNSTFTKTSTVVNEQESPDLVTHHPLEAVEGATGLYNEQVWKVSTPQQIFPSSSHMYL